MRDAAMLRRVEPEWLDQLPTDDPRAIRRKARVGYQKHSEDKALPTMGAMIE